MIRNVAGYVTFSLFKAGARIDAPTLAAGDATVATGAGAQGNVTNLPTADAAGRVTWNYTAAEANADYVTLLMNDVIGAEWEPLTIHFDTVTNTAVYNYLDAAISSRGTADPGDAMTLTAAYDAAKTAAQPGDAMALTGAERIATAGVFLATILEGAHTVADGLRIMLAALAGRSTGGGTFTNRFRDVADAKNRIDATVDANGNRTAITIDGTP